MTTWSRRDVVKVALAGGAALAAHPRTAWGRGPATAVDRTGVRYAGHGDAPPPGRATVKAGHVPTVLYAAHLVAESGGYFKKEGLSVELVSSPVATRSAQIVAAANQVHYMLGDTGDPQRLTDQGKPAVILYVIDQKCPYANLVVRNDLYAGGLTSIDKLATMTPKHGGKWKAGAMAIGSGPWMYGNFILRALPAGGGRTVNDMVEWISVGGIKAWLSAMKTGKIDLGAAVPEFILETESQDIGRPIFDARDDRHWLPLFKGPISATGSYALRSTVRKLREETQAYVSAVYRAVQWIKGASSAEIASALERYQDTMGVSGESVVKTVDWYKAIWTYDLVLTRENYDNVLNVASRIKPEKTFTYEEIVDLSFLRKASANA